jgi:hypothetical protein
MRCGGRLPTRNGAEAEMVENRVVAHLRDGRIRKGIVHDFDPSAEAVHLLPAEGGGIPIRIVTSELKALFFVKDFVGNREYRAPNAFGKSHTPGRRCIVTFLDGESIYGTAPQYDRDARGFMLYPVDDADNNIKLFVSHSAVREVSFP